jgi:phenylpyruvate tautomerase PptA (4-oxalocrotonate tautomerase family)
MSYSSVITYEIYDLKSSLFLDLIKEILEAEFTKQIEDYENDFLPSEVKTDEYLLNPVSDLDIDPSFCSIIKAKSVNGENQFHNQTNEKNTFIIGILAEGLENLRKISDAIYIILNDMDVKNYIFGQGLLADSGSYKITELSSEFQVSKTINDREIIYGYLTLEAEIMEVPKLNTYEAIDEVSLTQKVGANEIEITQTSTY